MNTNNIKISIITPVYNSEKFIGATIESVLAQTHSNFEMLCVDDISSDNSEKIIKEYALQDTRIRYIRLNEKGGASIARNAALENAKGDYVAFLDADDTWYPNKLESQLNFMLENSFSFTYTKFDHVNELNEQINIRRKTKSKVSYSSLLYRNNIGCLTVMYNRNKVGLLSIPRIDKRNDYALWLQALKKLDYAYELPEILSSYRVVSGSLSNSGSKISLAKYHYILFKDIEGFNIFKSTYYSFCNIINIMLEKIKYR